MFFKMLISLLLSETLKHIKGKDGSPSVTPIYQVYGRQ